MNEMFVQKTRTIQYVVKKSREIFLQEKLKTGLNDPFLLPKNIGYSNKKLHSLFWSIFYLCK